MRALARGFGIVLIVAGTFFALQGLGIIMWPAESFMLADRQWTVNGAIMAVIGLALVLFCRRR